MQKRLPFKYIVQAFQKDQFWLPAALWALFVLMTGLFISRGDADGMARAFLGYLLPLISGGLGAYAVLQDDALELQFATARPAWRMLLERLGIVLGVISITALTFQLVMAVMSIDLGLGSFWHTQWIWLVPNFSLIVVASMISLLATNSHSGFAFAGTLWIVELLLRGWFIENRVARYFLLFFGVMSPHSELLTGNQLSLLAIAAVSLLFSIMLLKKQERYI